MPSVQPPRSSHAPFAAPPVSLRPLRLTVLALPGVVALTLALEGCAHSQTVAASSTPTAVAKSDPTPPTARALSQSSAELQALQTLFDQRQFAEVIAQATALEQKKTSPGDATAQVVNLRGLSYLLTQRPVQASLQFQRALTYSGPVSPLAPFIRFNLAAAQFEMGKLADAATTAAAVTPESLDRETRQKLHTLRVRIASGRAQWDTVLRESLALGRLADSKTVRAVIGGPYRQGLSRQTSGAWLEKLYSEFEDSALVDSVLARSAELDLAAQLPDAAREKWQRLVRKFPESPHYADAMTQLKALESQPVASASATPESGGSPSKMHYQGNGSVGLLVPLTGKFASFGERALRAAQLALDLFTPTGTGATDPKAKPRPLVVADTGDDPDQALAALDRLALEEHASVIVGPLLSKGSEKLNRRADELGVPLLNLSQVPGTLNEHALAAGVPPELQATQIARYAIENLGLKRFAILHPREKLGEVYANAFWNAVESMGGRITGIESYNAGETDFRQAVDRLSGLYYTEARTREISNLARQREQLGIKKRTRKTEVYFALPPIIDYEAVFIPDEAAITGQIIPTFAYRDVDPMIFLGTSRWNSTELSNRLQLPAGRIYFADLPFNAASTEAVTRRFTDQFKKTFNQVPGSIEAMVYDATELGDLALRSTAHAHSSQVLEKLRTFKGYGGVAGKLTVEDNVFSRPLKILTLADAKISEAPAAPQKPAARETEPKKAESTEE